MAEALFETEEIFGEAYEILSSVESAEAVIDRYAIDITADLEVGDAENHLRAMAWHQAEIDEVDAHADAEIAKIEAWRERRHRQPNRKIKWHEYSVKAWARRWFRDNGKSKLDLAYGTVRRTKGRESIKVHSEQALDEWTLSLRDGKPLDKRYMDMVWRYSKKPDLAGIKKYIQETGEIPSGADLVDGEDSFTVTLPTEAGNE